MARRMTSELAFELSSKPTRLPRRSAGRGARDQESRPGSAPVGSTSLIEVVVMSSPLSFAYTNK